MTVRTAKRRHRFQPGSVMAAEALPFQFLSPSDIVVRLVGVGTLRRDVDYAIRGDGPSGTGEIVPLRAFAAGQVVEARRITANIQDTRIIPLQPLPALSTERTLDRQSMVLAEIADDLADTSARAIVLPEGEVALPLPSSMDRRDTVVYFDAITGEPVVRKAGSFPAGPPGGAANVAMEFGQIRDAKIANGVMVAAYDGTGSPFVWTPGDFTGRVDDRIIIGSSIVSPALGAWVRQTNAILRPAMFGAKGDGVTNDNNAFRLMTAVVNTLSGGVTIDLEGKSYVVGAQQFAGAAGLGYAYRPLDPMFFRNCTKLITINGNGAKIRWASGLRFGAFDPVTGAPKTGISTEKDFRADAGYTILGFNCPGGVLVYDVDLDGNAAGFIRGGQFGDTGYQLGHYGVYWEATPGNAEFTDPHDFCLDGFGIAHPGCTIQSKPIPVSLRHCRSERNGRQGLSIVGGKGHRINECIFVSTGKAVFTSAPSAGIDIEAEQAVIRDILIDNCTIADNVGVGIVADSGDIADVTVRNSSIFGTQAVGSSSYSVWPNKPRIIFENCRFSGTALSNYDAQAIGDANIFRNCIFYDTRWLNKQPFGTRLLDANTNGRFETCQFYAFDPAITLGFSTARNQFSNCSFIQNGSTGTSNIRGRFYGDNKFDIVTGQCDWGASVGSVNFGWLQHTGALINIAALAGEVAATSQTILRDYRFGLLGDQYVKRLTIACDNPVTAAAAFGTVHHVVNTKPVLGKETGWVPVDGNWQPTGIVGLKQATGITAASTLSELIAALKSSGVLS